MSTSLAGRPLVEASWALLKRDPSMVVLLVVGGFAASAAFVLVALPTYLIVGLPVDGTGGPVDLVVYSLAVFASTLVSTFFLGAVVSAAMQRADGGDPTFGSAMAAAWERRRELVAWAAMAAAVGVALRLLERFGVAGTVVRLLAGVTWAVATAFAIPVIMAEGTMPLDTVKRSAHVLTSRFGTNARATLRLGVVVILVWIGLFAMFMLGLYGVYEGGAHRNAGTLAVGALLLIAALLGSFIASAVISALGAYLRTVLYRYATGLPTPGIDPWRLPPLLPLAPGDRGGHAAFAGTGVEGGLATGYAGDPPVAPPTASSLFAWPAPASPAGPIPPPYAASPLVPPPYVASPLIPPPYATSPMVPPPHVASPMAPPPYAAPPLAPPPYVPAPLIPPPYAASPMAPPPYVAPPPPSALAASGTVASATETPVPADPAPEPVSPPRDPSVLPAPAVQASAVPASSEPAGPSTGGPVSPYPSVRQVFLPEDPA